LNEERGPRFIGWMEKPMFIGWMEKKDQGLQVGRKKRTKVYRLDGESNVYWLEGEREPRFTV